MGFEKKTWKQRLSEYPTRRRLIYADGSTETVDVERLEGTISQEGDAFSEENMNDLEERIYAALAVTALTVSDKSATVEKGSKASIASLSLTAGTWLVFGGCTFGPETADSGTIQYKVCLSTSSAAFDATNEGCISNINGAQVSANCTNLFTFTNTTTIHLLAYNGHTNSNDVTNGRINAIKIG